MRGTEAVPKKGASTWPPGDTVLHQPRHTVLVDKEVQLVCKYLKALRVGGTRGVDRLYQEGKESHFTSHCALTHTPAQLVPMLIDQ